ncbi:MAG: serine/threonine-protein kinase [Anaerolineae bacterium]|nr:serine/threonine-protein kinase [Anaerolineae bacterium]
MEISPNTQLKERYRIESKLGKGGMGAVFLAYDTALDTRVAIKANINTGSHSSRQFIREAQLLAGLRHPNLPRVTDYFVLEDVQYLVMDYIPGEDLGARLEREGPQPLEKVVGWAKQLGQALGYLHTQEPPIIHRDIKPSNIKITPQGQLSLVDFGIAKTSGAGKTTTGTLGLTPGYAPPEQYGTSKTGPYSDQYALAATLYALLVGEPPVESVERMLGRAVLTPPKTANAAIPDNVNSAIQRGLAIQPEERFAEVRDFTAALADNSYRYSPAGLETRKAPEMPELTAAGKRSKLPLALGGLVIAAAIAVMAVVLGGKKTPETALGATGTAQALLALPTLPSATSGPTAAVTPTVTPQPTQTEAPPSTPTPTGSGGLIAFVSNRVDAKIFQIYTMRADGSDVRQLTFDIVSKSQPAWSPDGKQLLYAAHGGRDIYTNDLGLDIWVINADGSNPTNLTQSIGDDYAPAWSPDGQTIAFVSERQFNQRNIHFMRPDGTEQKNITLGYASEYGPAWSPDGSWLSFTISIRSAPGKLFLRTAKGKDPRPFDISFRLGEIESHAWSPDGQFIAFTKIIKGVKEIFVVVVETTGAEIFQLTDTLGSKEPSWSPDSQWIVFTSTRTQNSEIYVMDSFGRVQTNISNHEAVDKEPAWQPGR